MDQSARSAALERVAFVFGKPLCEIHPTDRFDVELKARPASDFKHNEFDMLSEDVQEMLEFAPRGRDDDIQTVEAYCELVEKYSRLRPEDWRSMLAGWRKQQRLASAPTWRRALWKIAGV